MAMELARRWTSAGKKVLLICRSQWLKNFLMADFRLPNLTISTLEALAITVRRARIECYDFLLVDEGQDLFDVELLHQVEAYLSGGFEHGRWVFFHDINNQAGLFGKVDEKVFSKLKCLAPVQIPLRRNCRNTANILDVIREYTGADMGVEAVGAGPIVKIAEATSATQLINILKQSVVDIIDHGGLPAAELTILTDKSPRCFMQNVTRFLSCKVAVLDDYSMQHFPPNSVSLTSIDAFKGLENTAVILCLDKNNYEISQQKLLNYVGMSRARVLLHVIFLNEA